jgi:hypothetical protein
MEEAFEEGQCPHKAVEPVMMMMMMAVWKKKKVLTRPGFDHITPCVRVQYATTELTRRVPVLIYIT